MATTMPVKAVRHQLEVARLKHVEGQQHPGKEDDVGNGTGAVVSTRRLDNLDRCIHAFSPLFALQPVAPNKEIFGDETPGAVEHEHCPYRQNAQSDRILRIARQNAEHQPENRR